MTRTDLPTLAQILFEHGYFIGFVTACHADPAIQAIYQFARYDADHRVMVRCPAGEGNCVPTISHIYPGADWHERETRDFFGLTFSGHPNMNPFILDASDKDLAPLLKSEKTLAPESKLFPGKEAHE